MALVNNKQIVFNSYSQINGETVVMLNATIPFDTGVGSTSQFIQNAELYEANKSQVRRDIAEFTELIYSIEDEIALENSQVTTAVQ